MPSAFTPRFNLVGLVTLEAEFISRFNALGIHSPIQSRVVGKIGKRLGSVVLMPSAFTPRFNPSRTKSDRETA